MQPDPARSAGSQLMIVMYHYVRRIAGSDCPGIKGREITDFEGQIAYLKRWHRIVGLQEIVAATRDEAPFPDNAVVLTFDDGYSDHYENVFPVLQKMGVTGTFFVPECAVDRRRVLDVNKVHFLLASATNIDAVVAEIERAVDQARQAGAVGLRPLAEYRQEFWAANRFDPPEVIYIKRMLQHALPDPVRLQILDALFHRWVSPDERDFADRLYMSENQLREMSAAGMLVGAHGANHLWMNRCDIPTQAQEIEKSAAMLERLGVPQANWTFCYPYGAYNADTLTLISQRGFVAGVTADVALARFPGNDPLLISRIDTNDVPVSANSPANQWSQRLRAAVIC